VAFISHLLVQLSTVAFQTRFESAWTEEARNIASFAYRHYEKANPLDSVTVMYRERVRGGLCSSSSEGQPVFLPPWLLRKTAYALSCITLIFMVRSFAAR
jgi:hypothetical protein